MISNFRLSKSPCSSLLELVIQMMHFVTLCLALVFHRVISLETAILSCYLNNDITLNELI